MGKTKELDKTKKNELATNKPMPWVMEGADDSDKILPMAVIVQDSRKQKDKLGDHPDGTLVDSSTQEAITEPLFAPIFGYKEYIAWKPRTEGGGIIYRTRDVNDVPPGDLEWTGSDADRQPPVCTIHRNFFVVFKGAQVPVVLSFKSSSKYQTKAAKLINTMMDRRSKLGNGPAFFKISIEEEKNAKGEWFEPVVTFAGDCDCEETAKAIFEWGQFVQTADSNIEQADSIEEVPY